MRSDLQTKLKARIYAMLFMYIITRSCILSFFKRGSAHGQIRAPFAQARHTSARPIPPADNILNPCGDSTDERVRILLASAASSTAVIRLCLECAMPINQSSPKFNKGRLRSSAEGKPPTTKYRHPHRKMGDGGQRSLLNVQTGEGSICIVNKRLQAH